jgi:glycosidase
MNRLFSFLLLFALLLSAIGSPVQAAQVPETGENLLPTDTAKADVWCVAGGFQGWNNTSHPLYDDATHGDLLPGDGVFSLEQAISAAGRYEFKVVGCGTWTGYPTTNAWFNTSSAGQTVRFTFDTNNHSSDAGPAYAPAQNIVNLSGETNPASYTAAGDFQGWDNANPATLMTQVGPGLYRLSYGIAVPGTYMYKAVVTGSLTWDAFAVDGRSTNSSPLSFTTTNPNQEVIFLLDVYSGRILALPNQTHAGSWCVAGGFNGWNASSNPLNDDGINGDLLGNDGVFSADVPVATADRYEFKVNNCTWDISYPGSGNSWLITSTDNRTVKFTFDTNNHNLDVGPDYLPATNIIQVWDDLTTAFTLTAAGSFNGWSNSDAATLMTGVGGGLYQYNYTAGATQTYSGKVVQTGIWDGFGLDGRSVNASNIDFNANLGQVFYTVFDARTGRVVFFPGVVPETHASHDNTIWWADLGHDSRSDTYRTPTGPVTTGTAVTLRLRAAAGDLTAARVRIWNDRTNTQSLHNMTLVATDDTYEWWQVTLPAYVAPTVFWYRFIAIDGTATAYYEDDATWDGGWGAVFDTSPDNSYQLTIYDPAYHTPDWMKNAVVYQVFPDRFRDGDATNDTAAGSFFYGEAGGTIYRSTAADWNTVVCDPRQTGTPCSGTYSKNFYGGDIQGLIDKLDYLQGLGVTAIYMNPVFASPSNHGYDTTNYLQINPSMGDQVVFEALATQAHARGINLILDGVFNHVSSDSIYFDRYSRYTQVGACESPASPYRTWFYFTDVTPGTGTCAGSDGTPLAANYTSWWGYDSLPKLNSSLPAVRDLVYADGTNSVAPFWLQWADGWRLDVGGDVDPGVLSDPANTYWEEFRAAVHAVKPDAVIIGEEWGNGSSWLLGNEWDAVMNYQFSTAALGFWRDTTFLDNDHSIGSSAGPINPLTPSQFENKMRSLEERYPAEAFQAMLNLFGSHDTSRALFMLDENAGLNDQTLYANPNYDWSDAIARLKAAVILQMTLPGAPTIYYGDEVGLVGPMAYSGGKWEDDPYNRQPYPWLDESGTPFYTHLQSQVSQDALYDYYADLTEARNDHPALRTGDYRTLLVDDTHGLYAFGRRITGTLPDAAIVVVNQDTTPQPVVLDVAGYLTYGSTFTDVLTGGTFTVTPSGQINIPAVPARSGVVLVLQSGLLNIPPAINTLAVTAEGNGTLDLGWTGLPVVDRYRIYRSILSGGGYEYIGETTTSIYHDTGLTNAVKYYYVIASVNDGSGLVSGYSNQASGIPHPAIGWSNLQSPPTLTHTIGAIPTENIYGQIWVDGVTNASGQVAGILAQVGYGADGSDPATTVWNWWDAAFNADIGNNDEYRGTLLPEAAGNFDYAYRYSTDGGNSWVYADLDGSSNGYQTTQAGALTVIGSADITAPTAPVLSISDWGADFINLAWTAATDNVGIYAYDLYRYGDSEPIHRIARILSPDLTYTDAAVTTGVTYSYQVQAVDTSFNLSEFSNTVSMAPAPKIVSVTLNLTVPDFTPTGDTVYFTRYINPDGTLGDWNPAATAMTQVDATHWTLNFNLLDGTLAAFKFTRGDWETVIKGADGNEELSDLTFTTAYGTTGLQTVAYTVLNWRDPIVTSHNPLDGAIDVDPASLVQVTFSQAMNPADTFVVKLGAEPVAGTFSYDAATYTFTFTPTEPFWRTSTYTVTVAGLVDFGGDVQHNPVTFSFSTTPLRYYLAIISK